MEKRSIHRMREEAVVAAGTERLLRYIEKLTGKLSEKTAHKNQEEAVMDTVVEKACKQCEKSYPVTIEHWAPQYMSSDGHMHTCRACVTELRAAGQRRRQAEKKLKAEGLKLKGDPPGVEIAPMAGELPPGAKLRTLPPIEAGPNILSIDFAGREIFLEDLEKQAADNFRTPEQQALFYVFSGVYAGGGLMA